MLAYGPEKDEVVVDVGGFVVVVIRVVVVVREEEDASLAHELPAPENLGRQFAGSQ